MVAVQVKRLVAGSCLVTVMLKLHTIRSFFWNCRLVHWVPLMNCSSCCCRLSNTDASVPCTFEWFIVTFACSS